MIRVELRKQLRRLRTYIGLGICFGLPVIITIALKVGGPPHERGGGGAEEGFFRLATKSGVNMPIAALSVMSMFLLSTMTDFPVGTVAGSMGFVIVSQILDGITAVPAGFRNWLPTHFWNAWHGLFLQPSTLTDMIRGTLHQLPYAVGFLVLAWWWFKRKDVLS